MLRHIDNIVFKLKGLSFKKVYANIGNMRYDKPKNTNLADHTDPNSFTK